jgi:3-hydroxyisobutyrate dehydrogenase-like beta-hydroxyacid dehydrogenase
MAKDMQLALGDAAGQGVTLPMTQCAADRFAAAVAAGDGDRDAAVVVEIPTTIQNGASR